MNGVIEKNVYEGIHHLMDDMLVRKFRVIMENNVTNYLDSCCTPKNGSQATTLHR